MANSDSGLAEILKAVPQGAESVFPKAEYDRRIGQLQRLIAEKSFDLVLLSGPENIFYLTGQQTPGYYTFQCLCVPASGPPFHVLRALEASKLQREVRDLKAQLVGLQENRAERS